MRWILFLIFVSIGAMTPHPLESSFFASHLSAIRAEANESVTSTKEIKLLVSLTWNGPNADRTKLNSFKNFRTRFSNVPITHFISPSYFTSEKSNLNQTMIRSIYLPGDQIGLAIAPWKSIVKNSGVLFRSSPTFWGESIAQTNCDLDCGGEVPFSVYTDSEVKSIFKTALNIMEKQGFSSLKGMQVAGWMATPEILSAAEDFGIKYDFSMTTPSLLAENLRSFPIYSWVDNLWGKADILNQPSTLWGRNLTLVPQSLASLDYVTVTQMASFLDRFVHSNTKTPLTYHIALNAESLHITLPKLELVLQNVFKQASEGRFHLSMFL